MACSKIRYETRGKATKARRRIDRTLRAYLCASCGLWHLGHLPESIRRGERTRADIYGDEAA